MRSAIRGLAPAGTPAELRTRILAALERETALAPRHGVRPARLSVRPVWRTRPFWLGALGGMAGTAMAAALAFFALAPVISSPLPDDLMAAHVRSLMPTHLIDVTSTDQHTVKPWFSGRADVSPVVVDFASQGYRLVGGRADYLQHQRAAVVVYQHGPHVINVFSWAAAGGSLPRNTAKNGYRMAFFRLGDLDYCAVSDTGWDELQSLVRLIEAAGRGDAPRQF
jgi:anti-sigma factor RsiW